MTFRTIAFSIIFGSATAFMWLVDKVFPEPPIKAYKPPTDGQYDYDADAERGRFL